MTPLSLEASVDWDVRQILWETTTSVAANMYDRRQHDYD
jgi:hypothetical protein